MTIHEIPRSQLIFRHPIYLKIFYPIYQFLWVAFVTRGQIYDPKGPEQLEIAIKQFRRRARFNGYQAFTTAAFCSILGSSMLGNEGTQFFGIGLIVYGVYCSWIASDLIKFEREEEMNDKINRLEQDVKKIQKKLNN